MNKATYKRLESLLYQYACDVYTARQVQRKLAKLGYKADLKGDSHIVEVVDNVNGNYYQVEI